MTKLLTIFTDHSPATHLGYLRAVWDRAGVALVPFLRGSLTRVRPGDRELQEGTSIYSPMPPSMRSRSRSA